MAESGGGGPWVLAGKAMSALGSLPLHDIYQCVDR